MMVLVKETMGMYIGGISKCNCYGMYKVLSKQEEIKEMIAETASRYKHLNSPIGWENLPGEERGVWYEIADLILKKLVKQGVVIKGEQDPKYIELFKVEPLIREK